MSLREDYLSYLDKYGLPAGTGNPLTELGTYSMLSYANGIPPIEAIASTMLDGIARLEKEPGLYNKKLEMNGIASSDEVTHDDILGVISFWWFLDTRLGWQELIEIYMYGEKRGFTYSNTGEVYLDSLSKPDMRAVIKWAARQNPQWWEKLYFTIHILFSAYFQKDDAGSKRIDWLMINIVETQSKLCDWAIRIWRKRINMKSVFSAYHGPDHPFTRYCP